jgi:hypothetical protein
MLRHEETLIDSKYCASCDNKYHCFWFIDKQYSVWKCFSEKNAKESNWTLSKYAFNAQQPLNLFFKPAMTYKDYYLLSCLWKIKCFHKLLKGDKKVSYKVVFNGLSTKMIIVKQSKIDT